MASKSDDIKHFIRQNYPSLKGYTVEHGRSGKSHYWYVRFDDKDIGLYYSVSEAKEQLPHDIAEYRQQRTAQDEPETITPDIVTDSAIVERTAQPAQVVPIRHDSLIEAIKTISPNETFLQWLDSDDSKDRKSRIELFVFWLDDSGNHWIDPKLGQYLDYLRSTNRMVRKPHRRPDAFSELEFDIVPAKPLSAASANAHLATIRGYYLDLIEDSESDFEAVLDEFVYQEHGDLPLSDRQVLVDKLFNRIQRAVKPSRRRKKKEEKKAKVIKKQDTRADNHLRLKRAEANRLMSAPGTNTYTGLRDTAIISLMLATGLREGEIAALTVDDLRTYLGGSDVVSIFVAEGKGSKSRYVPYGALVNVLDYVERWLDLAKIKEGYVFAGFKAAYNIDVIGVMSTPDGQPVAQLPERLRRDDKGNVEPITTRAIQNILKSYPIRLDNGTIRTVKPHDLRRTCARLLHKSGMGVEKIQYLFGHKSYDTTLGYIGYDNEDLEEMKPGAILDFPELAPIPKQLDLPTD